MGTLVAALGGAFLETFMGSNFPFRVFCACLNFETSTGHNPKGTTLREEIYLSEGFLEASAGVPRDTPRVTTL